MSHDRVDERAAELFSAARREAPSAETRRRISAALRGAAAPPSARLGKSRASGMGLRGALLLAAMALGALVITFLPTGRQPIDISAETLTTETGQPEVTEQEASNPNLEPPASVEAAPVAPPRSEAPKAPTKSNTRPVAPAPPSLEEELSAMQGARAALDRGDAASALSELDAFGRRRGWRELSVEASLLRVETLSKLGRSNEARAGARRFVEENPNNPLVDRAEQFARSPASPDASDAASSEGK